MVYVHYILYFCNAVWIVYELSYCSDYRPIKISLMFITLPSQQILRTLRQKCYIGLNLSIFPWRNISLNCNLYFKNNVSYNKISTVLSHVQSSELPKIANQTTTYCLKKRNSKNNNISGTKKDITKLQLIWAPKEESMNWWALHENQRTIFSQALVG